MSKWIQSDSILLQKQARDNSEELRNYLKDLSTWEDEMKRKESSNDNTNKEKDSSKKIKKQPKNDSNKKADGKNTQRIRSYDYKAWDKFDVDAECERLDKTDDGEKSESPEESSDSDFDASEEYQQRLRDEATYEKERGNQFVKQQKWSEAIACYTHAIACYPKDPIYFANRALCHLKKNDLHSAEADCTSALQFDPNYVKALQRRAAARIGLKQHNEALEDLRKVLQLEPNNKESKKELDNLEKILQKKQSKPAENVLKYIPPTEEKPKSQPEPKKIVSKIAVDNQSKLPQTKEKSQNVKESSSNLTEIKITWPIRPTSKPVKTVQKLPHQRSKTPLQKIGVVEVRDEPKKLDDLSKPSNSGVQKVLETPKPVSVHTVTKVDVPKIDFTVPKSLVQFLKTWKLVKNSKSDRLKYLQSIQPQNISKIFQDSMESDVFGEILDVLEDCTENDGYDWLCYLSTVKRFATLVMFMSSKDKEVVKRLFDNCADVELGNPDEYRALKKKYEI